MQFNNKQTSAIGEIVASQNIEMYKWPLHFGREMPRLRCACAQPCTAEVFFGKRTEIWKI